MELHCLTIQQLGDQLAKGQISSRQATEHVFERIERYDPDIHGYLELHREAGLAQADRIDKRRRQGENLGPLAGVPIAIKDNICISHGKTTCASKILGNFQAPYDAHVIQALNGAEAIILLASFSRMASSVRV